MSNDNKNGGEDGGHERPSMHDDALGAVLEKLTDICGRLSELEVERDQHRDQAGAAEKSKPKPSKFETNYETFVSASPLAEEAQGLAENRELAVKYQAVKDATKNIVLPSDLVLSENFRVSKPESKLMLALLRRSYGYVSTSLKLLKKLSEENDMSPAASKLMYTTLSAHAKTLQSESTTCFLEGAASHKDPMGLYKALNTNQNLTQNEKENYKLSAELFVAAKIGDNAGAVPEKSNKGGRAKQPSKTYYASGAQGGGGARQKSSYYGKDRERDRDHKDPFDSTVAGFANQKP